MRRKGQVALWPVYFDAEKSRGGGRRVPRRLAVKRPTLQDVVKAVSEMGLDMEVVEGAAHPREHWRKTGVVYVRWEGSKEELLREVAKRIRTMRQLK